MVVLTQNNYDPVFPDTFVNVFRKEHIKFPQTFFTVCNSYQQSVYYTWDLLWVNMAQI